MGPALDTVLAADLLQSCRAHFEGAGGIDDREVKAGLQHLQGDLPTARHALLLLHPPLLPDRAISTESGGGVGKSSAPRRAAGRYRIVSLRPPGLS